MTPEERAAKTLEAWHSPFEATQSEIIQLAEVIRDARNEALEAAASEADALADAYSNEEGCYIAESAAQRIRDLKSQDQAP